MPDRHCLSPSCWDGESWADSDEWESDLCDARAAAAPRRLLDWYDEGCATTTFQVGQAPRCGVLHYRGWDNLKNPPDGDDACAAAPPRRSLDEDEGGCATTTFQLGQAPRCGGTKEDGDNLKTPVEPCSVTRAALDHAVDDRLA